MFRTIQVALALLLASRLAAAEDRPSYRLGDAARPFGWSTAVGDFNTDGAPDVAVADHLTPRANTYAYRLELRISGQAPRGFTFESTHDAITIAALDVDRDDDLDLVVRTPVSGETVGVWLNDGHGHFTRGDADRVPASLGPIAAIDGGDAVAASAEIESSERRARDALPAAARAQISAASSRFAPACALTLERAPLSARTNPRAPPSTASLASR